MNKTNKTSNDLQNEEELIISAKEGNVDSFNKLIYKYNQILYNFSFKICRDEEKAKEAMQDTLINIYKSLKLFDGKSKFSTWLYKIISNNCLMMARSDKIKKFVSIDDSDYKISVHEIDLLQYSETPADKMLNDELKSKLDKAIKKLPLKYRLVFLLRDIEELSIEETSKTLKLSILVVKSRLHRARIFLRNQLKDYYEKKN
jgi:RNA polymerase sigma-70 factor (ECF subfamily)